MATPKYKVGDYLTNPTSIFLKVQAVVAEDASQPIYLLEGRHTSNGTFARWWTEFQCEDDKLEKGTPDFESFAALQPGDTIKVGVTDDRGYTSVLARVGEAVLLSNIPIDNEDDAMYKLTKQLAEMAGKSLEEEDIRNDLRKQSSMTFQHNVAARWVTVEQLALMNWQVVRE